MTSSCGSVAEGDHVPQCAAVQPREMKYVDVLNVYFTDFAPARQARQPLQRCNRSPNRGLRTDRLSPHRIKLGRPTGDRLECCRNLHRTADVPRRHCATAAEHADRQCSGIQSAKAVVFLLSPVLRQHNPEGLSVIGRATLPRSRLVSRVPIITRGSAGASSSRDLISLTFRFPNVGCDMPRVDSDLKPLEVGSS